MILLVVDMQPRFKASGHDWILENVAAEIRAAKSAVWGIMFLEYTRRSVTLACRWGREPTAG